MGKYVKGLFLFGWFLIFGVCFLVQPSLVDAAPSISTLRKITTGSIPLYNKFEIGFSITGTTLPYPANGYPGPNELNPYFPYDPNPNIDGTPIPTPIPGNPGIEAGIGITVDGYFKKQTQSWSQARVVPCFYYQPVVERGSGSSVAVLPEGQAEWRCRFSPQETGTWEYRVSAEDEKGTTESAIGSFFAVSCTNQSDWRCKGFIKVSQRDPRFFEFSNGEAFPIPLVSVEENHFGKLGSSTIAKSGIRYDVPKMADNGIRFIRWFPTGETGWLYMYGGWLQAAWNYDGSSSQTSNPDTTREKVYAWKPSSYSDQTFPAVAGATYRLRFRAYVPSSTTLHAEISFSSGGGQSRDIGSNGGWRDYDCEATNTSGSSTMTVEITGGGEVRVGEIVLQRKEGDSWGGNMINHGDANTHLYVDQPSAALFDELLSLSEQKGLYHKLPLFWKEDWALARIRTDGSIGTNDWSNFYGSLAVRWYIDAYARYFVGRWGYSTAIHSLELANENSPDSYKVGNWVARTVHLFTGRYILMSNSYWHWSGLSTSAWLDPSMDYADRHWYAAINDESDNTNGPDAVYSDQVDDPVQYGRNGNYYFKDYNRINGVNKPFVQGEGGAMDVEDDYGENEEPASDEYGNWYHKKTWVNLGALGYTCDGEWWPRLWDDYSSSIFPSNESDLFRIYKAYTDFLAGEPLSNGSHVEIWTDLESNLEDEIGDHGIVNEDENPNLRAFGSKDSATARVLVWVDNRNNTWHSNPAGTSTPEVGDFSISGMPNGQYTREVWDTRMGTYTTTSNAVNVTNGTLTFSASTGKDVAYKFYIPGAAPSITPTIPPNVPGDTDGDGDVDIYDYITWLNHYDPDAYQGGGSSIGDFDDNGHVDIYDYIIWLNNYTG